MRSDLILPVSLAVALVVMAGYAATGDKNDDVSDLSAAASVACEPASTLRTMGDIREASGLAASRRTPQLLWAHNDSADPTVYGVSADGAIRARVRIAGASVVDWEAITATTCASGSCLLIGDIGDNDRKRPAITVYRIDEPAVEDRTSTNATAIDAAYPEGPQDAEAMFALGDALFVVTKGEGSPLRVYRFPSLDAGTRHVLQLVAQLSTGPVDKEARVTDAAASPDARWVALRTSDRVLLYDAQAFVSGAARAPRAIDVRALREPQGEGLAWVDAQTLYLAGEGPDGGTLARVTCPAGAGG